MIDGAAGAGERDRVHRRAAHDRRRGRGLGRRDGRVEPDQAGAGQRAAALHRHHDAQGVPQLHREGPGAGAALPADRGRGAVDRGDGQGAAGAAPPLRGVPRRRLHRRGAAGGGRPVGALPDRPPAARQGHRPDRRGGRGGTSCKDKARKQRRDEQAARRRARRSRPSSPPWRASRPKRVAADDRKRLQDLEGDLRGEDLRPGRGGRARGAGHQDEPRRAGAARAADRLLPVRRADRASARPSWPSSWPRSSASRSFASTCRSTWSGTRCRA